MEKSGGKIQYSFVFFLLYHLGGFGLRFRKSWLTACSCRGSCVSRVIAVLLNREACLCAHRYIDMRGPALCVIGLMCEMER